MQSNFKFAIEDKKNMMMILMQSEKARLYEIIKTKIKEANIWKFKAEQS